MLLGGRRSGGPSAAAYFGPYYQVLAGSGLAAAVAPVQPPGAAKKAVAPPLQQAPVQPHTVGAPAAGAPAAGQPTKPAAVVQASAQPQPQAIEAKASSTSAPVPVQPPHPQPPSGDESDAARLERLSLLMRLRPPPASRNGFPSSAAAAAGLKPNPLVLPEDVVLPPPAPSADAGPTAGAAADPATPAPLGLGRELRLAGRAVSSTLPLRWVEDEALLAWMRMMWRIEAAERAAAEAAQLGPTEQQTPGMEDGDEPRKPAEVQRPLQVQAEAEGGPGAGSGRYRRQVVVGAPRSAIEQAYKAHADARAAGRARSGKEGARRGASCRSGGCC